MTQPVHLRQLQRRQWPDHPGQQQVGQFRVAGQAGPVQIGRDHAALHRTVKAVTHPITGALDHCRQRLCCRAQNRSAAVVFEPGQRLGQPLDQGRRHDLADRALRLWGSGDVEQADAVDPLTG